MLFGQSDRDVRFTGERPWWPVWLDYPGRNEPCLRWLQRCPTHGEIAHGLGSVAKGGSFDGVVAAVGAAHELARESLKVSTLPGR